MGQRVNKTNIRKSIMELINSHCSIKYPTYCQRIHHVGIKKTYRGFYTKLDSGFIICHRNSNLFKLYDDSILTPKIEEILEKSKPNSELENKMIGIFDYTDSSTMNPVIFACREEDIITAWTPKGSVSVPNKYYEKAHELLGPQTEKYVDEDSKGIYFESPRGKALVMRMK